MNQRNAFNLDVKNQLALLSCLIDAFPAETLMSFEGELAEVLTPQHLFSKEEREPMRRNTWAPRLDFWVFKLDQTTKAYLKNDFLHSIGTGTNVIHILAALGGDLLFASHDHFHPEYVFLYESVIFTDDFVLQLVEDGVLNSFEKVKYSK